MSADLFVKVDNEIVRLDDCCWVFTQPCGCVTGLMVAVTQLHCHATEDQAWEHYVPNRIQRERDRAAGERATLALLKDASKRLASVCPHDPKWGRIEIPVPDGHVWAASDAWRARPRYKHLVPEGNEPRDSRSPGRLYPWDHGKVAALCKRSQTRDWSDSPWITNDLPECSACLKAAEQWAVAA